MSEHNLYQELKGPSAAAAAKKNGASDTGNATGNRTALTHRKKDRPTGEGGP